MSNTERKLREVVAIESWYERFDPDTKTADLFLHVKFSHINLGGPDNSASFRLAIKRADIRVLVESPLRVPRRSVRRDRLNSETVLANLGTNITEKGVDAGIDASLNPSESSFALNGRAFTSGKQSDESTAETKIVTYSGFLVEHWADSDRNFDCWSVSPATGPVLLGQVFRKTEAILQLVHDGEREKIMPVVKVQIHCSRDDLHIYDLQVNGSLTDRLSAGIGSHKKIAIAHEIIKDELARSNLDFQSNSKGLLDGFVIGDILVREDY